MQHDDNVISGAFTEIKAEQDKIDAPLSGNELLTKDVPNKKVLLSPWLKEREMAMIYAAPGIGKTFFALNCAYALSSAKSFLHFKATEKLKVLYIDGEMDISELQERWKSVTKCKDDTNNVAFYTPYLFSDKIVPKLSADEGREFYNKAIVKTQAQVVVFDNLSILTDIDENKSNEWSKILTWLIQLKNNGITIILIHHTNKGKKEHRGSSKLIDFLNVAIHLEEVKDENLHRSGARFKIKYTKNRSIYGDDVKEIEAWLDVDGNWQTQDQATSTREKVTEYYNMGMSAKDITIETGISLATIYRHIDELTTAGIIKKRTHGNSR